MNKALIGMTTGSAIKSIARLCGNNILQKILSGVAYGAQANIYRPSTSADMELSTPQCVLLALLHSLVTKDIMSCVMLAEICHLVHRLRSAHHRVWLLEDFSFPQTDVRGAIDLLDKLLLVDGTMKMLPDQVLTAMGALAKQYRVPGILALMRPISEICHPYVITQIQNAVANNSLRDIFDLAFKGIDVSVFTPFGDSLMHLAARTGSSATIGALAILNVNLEALNSNNATPLLIAVRNNKLSSVKALLVAGAKADKPLPGGNTNLPYLCRRGVPMKPRKPS